MYTRAIKKMALLYVYTSRYVAVIPIMLFSMLPLCIYEPLCKLELALLYVAVCIHEPLCIQDDFLMEDDFLTRY